MPCELIGTWFARLYGEDGNLKEERRGLNLVTTVGKEAIASFLYSSVVSSTFHNFQYVAVGSGGAAAAITDVALGTELARVTGSVSYISGAIYSVTVTFPTGIGTGTIQEFGLFNSSVCGTILSHDIENAISKGSTDTLSVTYQLSFS